MDGLYGLRREVRRLSREVEGMAGHVEIPQMVESANLLRANESLLRSDAAKTELLQAYRKYAGALEGLLLEILDVQAEIARLRRAAIS
ncbi:conserved hypothetical protein [Nitrosopumilaceae archaeon]|nr:hypothetical protein [Nitrosopumilus sp.]CAI9831501.1 conserved hypothetical protein [Nitrosopumilaceae archaeon]MDA7944596.1 hypothetical protein [Nitrosopumilus sp.]MDA7953899.1 hypothetical protein [Nitrosopumilus sp.]MDA7973276.1 hypothetical protein [Nitrosopumilus sp.]